MLCVGGEWLLSDPGYGQVPTELHSTLLCEGKGQSASGGEMTAFGTVGQVSYAAGEAGRCYGGLARFTRHIVLAAKEYYVVVDELAPSAGPVEVTSQLVIGGEDPQIGEAGRIVLHGKQRCAVSLPSAPGETKLVKDRNTRLQTGFTLAEPCLKPMVLQPGRGDDARPVVSTSSGGAVLLRLGEGESVDYLLLNPTGEQRELSLSDAPEMRLSTDGRVLWVRVEGEQVKGWSLIWGSKASVGVTSLVDEAQRADRAG